jgi:hypothetical protein
MTHPPKRFPLYAFVRRAGYSAEDAQDLPQEFFARLLAKNYLAVADRQRGNGSSPSQQVSYLPSVFTAEPYTVAKEIALVEGARCVVLHVNRDVKNTVGGVSEVLRLDDTDWLDLDRAPAVWRADKDGPPRREESHVKAT